MSAFSIAIDGFNVCWTNGEKHNYHWLTVSKIVKKKVSSGAFLCNGSHYRSQDVVFNLPKLRHWALLPYLPHLRLNSILLHLMRLQVLVQILDDPREVPRCELLHLLREERQERIREWRLRRCI